MSMAETVKTLSLFQEKKYGDIFTSIPVLMEKDFFVQFNAYDIYLPKTWIGNSFTVSSESLNIFEQSVLRLLAVSNFTVEEIAEKLCLKPDLIKFILQRLSEAGLLDSNHRVTDEGNKKTGNTGGEVAETSEVKSFLMLVSRDVQKLMPIIFPKGNTVMGEIDKNKLTVRFGSIGGSKPLTEQCIFVKERGQRQSQLSQRQIFDAIGSFNRNTAKEKRIRFNKNIHVTSTYDGAIFLHAKAVLQNGFVDHMVASDGCLMHNDFLREYMERQRSDLFLKIKENAVKYGSQKRKQKNFSVKYPEIHMAMEKQKQSFTTVDELKKAEAKKRQQVGNLIKAVEWALFYHLRKFPPPPTLLKALANQTAEQNTVTLLDFADGLGLAGAKKFSKMFERVQSVAVVKCLNTQSPTLAILLPVNIAAAAKVPDNRIVDALKALADAVKADAPSEESKDNLADDGKNDKEVNDGESAFEFLNRIDRYGKEIRHDDEWHPIKGDDADDLYDKTLKFINILLPDYDNPSVQDDDDTNASLQKLNAELAVISTLGEELYRTLPGDIRDQLLKIYPSKQENKIPQPSGFVETLSVIMEKLLYNLLQKMPVISMTKKEVIARMRADGISDELATVNDIYFEMARAHQKATLGAYALAYMAALNDDSLREFVDKGIHELVHKISYYRGHSNHLGLVVDENILLTLRKEAFEAVRFLGGKLNERQYE